MATDLKRLVPLGSWCRTAFQCRQNAEKLGLLKTPSGPFDWTITPFRALSRALSNDIRSDLILNPYDSYINKVGSVTCGYTGLAFHHDLPIDLVLKHGGGKGEPDVPPSLLQSEKWGAARSRFTHTLGNLLDISKDHGNIFVRWLNTGRGCNPNFPEVFDGETPSKTYNLLEAAAGHNDFSLIYATSKIVLNVEVPIVSPVEKLEADSEHIFNCILTERKGRNGDQSHHFAGDDASWLACLDQALRSFSNR